MSSQVNWWTVERILLKVRIFVEGWQSTGQESENFIENYLLELQFQIEKHLMLLFQEHVVSSHKCSHTLCPNKNLPQRATRKTTKRINKSIKRQFCQDFCLNELLSRLESFKLKLIECLTRRVRRCSSDEPRREQLWNFQIKLGKFSNFLIRND